MKWTLALVAAVLLAFAGYELLWPKGPALGEPAEIMVTWQGKPEFTKHEAKAADRAPVEGERTRSAD